MSFLFAIVGAVVVFGIIMLFVKVPSARRFIPFLNWLTISIVDYMNYNNYQGKYSAIPLFASRSFILARAVALEGADLRTQRKVVGEIVSTAYNTLLPEEEWGEAQERATTAAYVGLINHKEIKDLVISLLVDKDYKNLEIRKATYLVIDVFGEIVDLSDDLGQNYFQHLVYGINKSLVLIRDHGTDQDNLKKVVAVLYRVYKISKAYRKLRDLSKMSEEEYYEKVSSSFKLLDRFVFN